MGDVLGLQGTGLQTKETAMLDRLGFQTKVAAIVLTGVLAVLLVFATMSLYRTRQDMK